MKRKVFRKNSFVGKVVAAALSATLAFGMTPAMAFAQPAEAPANSALTALDASEVTVLAPVNNTGMFKVMAAQLEGNKLRFTLSGVGYSQFYVGTYEEAVANGDGSTNGTWVLAEPAVTLSAGATEFVMDAPQAGEYTAIAAISNTYLASFRENKVDIERIFYPRYMIVDLENNTITTGDYEADTALAASTRGVTPQIGASASVHTVGGPNSNGYKENLTVETDAVAAYLGTAEAAAAAETGIVDAVNGEITITITPNNFAAGGKFSGIAGVAFKQADGTWIDTTVTLNKLAKTVSVVGELVPVTASVNYTAQGYGAFMVAPAFGRVVSSDLAESYGYTDAVDFSKSVSALDVFVAAHQDMFVEEYTAETAADYLVVSNTGWTSKLFGVETTANGFMLNGGQPNDGGEMGQYGYNGLMVNQTPVATGDLVDFYIYQDQSNWSDMYAYVDAPATVSAGEAFEVTVKGASTLGASSYIDGAAFKASMTGLEDDSVALVDIATGALTPLTGAADKDGKLTITLPEVGEYYLAPFSVYDEEGLTDALVMTLTKVTVDPAPLEKGVYSVDASVIKAADGAKYGMFPVTDPLVIVNDEGIFLTFTTGAKTTYHGAFLGPRSEASQDSPNYFEGTFLGDTYKFTLKISEENFGKANEIILYGGKQDTWYASDVKLDLGEPAACYAFSTVASANKVKPGETVTVAVVAQAEESWACGQFNLVYPTETLRLVSIQQGAGLTLGEEGSFEATEGGTMVTFYGNTAAANGMEVAVATFEAKAEGNATVTLDNMVAGAEGQAHDIEDVRIASEATITVAYAGDFTIAADEYVAGYKVATFVGEVPAGKVPVLAGTQMMKLGDNFVALVASSTEPTRADLDLVEATAVTVARNGDVNGNEKINIVDAQVAYDLANAAYSGFEVLGMQQQLSADVNNDGAVDALDARAIQHFVMTGSFN